MYTYPQPERIIEHPTKGRVAFTQTVINEFRTYVNETESFDSYIAVEEDSGVWLDAIVDDYDAAGLLSEFRNLTGQSTEDVEHASAVIYAAALQIWEALAGDYQVYLNEIFD